MHRGGRFGETNGQCETAQSVYSRNGKTAESLPIQGQVTLKPIAAGMDALALAARFVSERRALASMDHPNIARVFDAASTAQVQP